MSYIIGLDETEVSDTAKFALGQIGQNSDGKKYKYVQYLVAAGSVAAVSGNVAYYYAPSGVSAGSSTTVTSDLSDSAGLGAGVLKSAPTNTQYCWVQISGVATLTTALTAGADGNSLTPVGSTDGTLDVSAAVTDAICAYAVDASAKIVLCDFPE
jgi:hypothetical protein